MPLNPPSYGMSPPYLKAGSAPANSTACTQDRNVNTKFFTGLSLKGMLENQEMTLGFWLVI